MKDLTSYKLIKMRCINKETLDYVEIPIPMGTLSNIRLALLGCAYEYAGGSFGGGNGLKFDFYVVDIGKGLGSGYVRISNDTVMFQIDLATNKPTERTLLDLKEKGVTEDEFWGHLKPENLL